MLWNASLVQFDRSRLSRSGGSGGERGIPAGFIGAAEDVADLPLFLRSDVSRFIVGQTIICDGGQTLIMPLTGDFRGRRSEKWGPGGTCRDFRDDAPAGCW